MSQPGTVVWAFTEGQAMRIQALAGIVLGGLVVVGLTGCGSVSKDQYNALKQENADLHGEVTKLETTNREKEMQLAQAQQQQADLARNQPQPPVNVDPLQPKETKPKGKSGKSGGSAETLEIAGDVAFTAGSATLTPAAKKELDTFAKKLKGTYAGKSIRVEGHTDSRPITKSKSKWSSNEQLSQARADAVRSYLVTKGVSKDRIEAIGYGAAKPKKTEAASRRVDVVVLND